MVVQCSGKILNLGSIASFAPGPLMAVCYASKAYMLSFSEALTRELRGTGVTVTCLCPGPTDTGFAANASLPEARTADILPHPAPRAVAVYGYRCLMKGKAVAVHGLAEKAAVLGMRFMPRRVVRDMVCRMQRPV